MADNIRHVPERFGPVQQVWHPRITSMGRRLVACLPAAALGLICLGVLWFRRPAPMVSIIIVVVILVCLALCWVWLRPNTVVATASHLLGSRAVGFHTVRRDRIARAVLVEALEVGSRGPTDPGGKSRRRGLTRPYLWLVDDAGRRLFRLDGTVWDLKSLTAIVEYAGVPVDRFPRATAGEVAHAWPKVVGLFMRHPWIKSVLSGALLIATVAAVYWMAWQP